MNESQLYIQVSTGDDDQAEMLTNSYLRPYASLCLAAHFHEGNAHSGEQLTASIMPGQERFTTFPDTKCLLSFVVEIANQHGELIGSCEFQRAAFIDHVRAIASRILAKQNGSDSRKETEVVAKDIQYCLHFTIDGSPLSPRVRIPPIRETDIDALGRGAKHLLLSSGNSSHAPAVMTTFIMQEVYDQLESLAERSELSGLEEGCLLDGEVLFDPRRRRFARLITEFIPAVGADQGEASLRINGDCWSHYYKTHSGEGVLLAEGHSHPSILTQHIPAGSVMFVSSSDRGIHRQFFWQFFQSTVILSKPENKGFQLGVWGWHNGFIVPEQEAYILGA